MTIASCSKSSSNDSSESKTDSTVAKTVAATSSTSSAASTESSTTITTTTPTTIATTTVAETSPVSNEDINSASISAMADLLKPSTNGAIQPIFNGYELADINNDKIPELIVSYKSMTGKDLIHLFVYEEGRYTKIEKYKNGTNDEYPYISEDCSYDPEKGLISYDSYEGGTARYILQLTNDNRLVLSDLLLYYSSEYTHNGDVVSESEYNALNAEFDSSYNWKKLDIKPRPDEVQSTAAPKETYKYIGVVTLNSGTLNLRDFPSTDSNVITQLTNGTRCTVYSLDGYSDWYKIYVNDVSGYVAVQYIKEDQAQKNNDNSSLASDPIIGKWNLSYITYQGYPDATEYYDDSIDYSYTFYPDGTACFSNEGDKETFNYKKYGNNEYGWEGPVLTLKNGELVWAIGIRECHFVKE